jgi:hypothetical protein
MKGIFAALVAVGMLAGCAVSKEAPGKAFPGILVIGTTGPSRSIEDKDRPGFYSAYLKTAGQWHRIRVRVPDSLAHDTRFASPAGSAMFGTTGDLVVAKGDRDGVLWLERVLCRDDATYRACAGNYQSGIFDENTGQELARDRKPKPGGVLVDVTSYLKLPQESGHHSASELDVREADHCDCNRALPGSAQSSVHVPEVDK